MGTFWGKLKANKRLEIPRHFIFYDTETYRIDQQNGTIKHYLKLGVACYLRRGYRGHYQREDWLHFTTIKQFWNWVEGLCHSKMRIYIIAHNQQFDSFVIDTFRELPKRKWVLTLPVIDSNLFIATFRKGTTSLIMLDSLNWFKFSLKKLGDFVGIKKLEINFDSCSNESLDTYCTSDVLILKQTMLKWITFLRYHNLGCFKYTIASQAFTAYRHRFMKTPIHIHAHPEATLLERDSYRGGRNEAFRLGEIKPHVTLLDFNGLYASIMIKKIFPTNIVKYVSKSSLAGLKRALSKYLVIAKVNITINEPSVALKTERLIFPIGTFEVTLTTPELVYVFQHGKVNKIYELALYNYDTIFTDYVTSLYQERLTYKQANDSVGELMTKLFLNSLYGKFGQRVQEQELIGHANPSEITVEKGIVHETGERVTIKTFAGNVYKIFRGERESKNSFPAIASFVTSYARMKLWNAILLARRENVIYVDTDSLFVNDTGLKRLSPLINEEKLGALKIEGNGNDLYINGLKDYVFLEETKIKGVKKNAVKISLTSYKQSRFLKFRTLQRKGFLNAPVEDTVTKHLLRDYKKGLVANNGSITPFELS